MIVTNNQNIRYEIDLINSELEKTRKEIGIKWKELKKIENDMNKIPQNKRDELDDLEQKRQEIFGKREFRFRDFMHKIARSIINYCLDNDIDAVVIGYNSGWKEEKSMSKNSWNNFQPIPFLRFIEKLKDKGEENGIDVIDILEPYTSVTSAMHLESFNTPKKNRRGKRGVERFGKLSKAELQELDEIRRKKNIKAEYKANGIIVIKKFDSKENRLQTFIKFKPDGQENWINTINLFKDKKTNTFEYKKIHHRGLFKTREGFIIHSDVNGSFNIYRGDPSNINAKAEERDYKEAKFIQIQKAFHNNLGILSFDQRRKIMQKSPIKINKINDCDLVINTYNKHHQQQSNNINTTTIS